MNRRDSEVFGEYGMLRTSGSSQERNVVFWGSKPTYYLGTRPQGNTGHCTEPAIDTVRKILRTRNIIGRTVLDGDED